jgi:hypothetical protein
MQQNRGALTRQVLAARTRAGNCLNERILLEIAGCREHHVAATETCCVVVE